MSTTDEDGSPTGSPTGEPAGSPKGEPTVEPAGSPTGEPVVSPDRRQAARPSGSPTFRRTALSAAALATVLGLATVVIANTPRQDGSATSAQVDGRSARLSMVDPYIPLPAAGSMAAGYLTVRNDGPGADQLVKVSSPTAASVTMHRSSESTMMEIDSFPVPAHGALELSRGGNHLMIMGLNPPPVVGGSVELDLTFSKSGTIAVKMPVQPITYRPGS